MEKTILLVCAAGMSTSMLVTKMNDAAESEEENYNIYSASSSEADNELEKNDIHAILLGPQVRYMKKQFEEKGEKYNVPVGVINTQDYGMMRGENVLNTAKDMIAGAEND